MQIPPVASYVTPSNSRRSAARSSEPNRASAASSPARIACPSPERRNAARSSSKDLLLGFSQGERVSGEAVKW